MCTAGLAAADRRADHGWTVRLTEAAARTSRRSASAGRRKRRCFHATGNTSDSRARGTPELFQKETAKMSLGPLSHLPSPAHTLSFLPMFRRNRHRTTIILVPPLLSSGVRLSSSAAVRLQRSLAAVVPHRVLGEGRAG